MSMRRRRDRTAEIMTTSILAALFVLAGLGGMLWLAQSGALSGPTPTPTSTSQPAATATPDFRATRTAQDIMTQIAYSVQLATLAAETMSGGGALPATGPLPEATLFPPGPDGVAVAPTGVSIMLPVVAQADAAAATATWAAYNLQVAEATAAAAALIPVDSPLPTPGPVQLPIVDQGVVPPTWTPIPTPTPSPTLFFVTDTPTFTPMPPTATLPPPTPTIQYTISTLRALVDRQNAIIRVGPSVIYTQTGQINTGAEITLLARDTYGEWLHVCCIPGTNNPGWIRSVAARPTNNPTLIPPLPTNDGDDIRWLQARGPDSGLTPMPVTTPIPPTDFPMARHDRFNSGKVPELPRLPLTLGWPVGGQSGVAGQAFTSAAIVAGTSVIAASADGHLYSFDRESGSQRWRYYLGDALRATPLFEGGLIYVVAESGRLIALQDQGNNAALILEQQLNMQPRGGIVAASNRLILTGRRSDGEHLLVLDRSTGGTLRDINLGSAIAQMPAVGNQLIFVASDLVRAYDLYLGDSPVWQSAEAAGYSSPPLYSSPGVEALAEIYVADGQGRVTAFDANTGTQIWITGIGAVATSLAANNSILYAAGPGFVRGLSRAVRSEGQTLWSFVTAGAIPGGPLVDDTRVLLVTEGGSFQYLDAFTGAVVVGNVQAPPLSGGYAVSGPWIYAPTQLGVLFAARWTGQ